MPYLIDPRKNWALAEKQLAEESDPRRRQILQTLIRHNRAEAQPDFEALMSTVSPRAHYHSYATDDPAVNEAQSPRGKAGVEAYYRGIVGAGCHRIEHDVERLTVGRDSLTTEGHLRIAYPGTVLGAMGFEDADPAGLFLYEQRLLIVWEFDAEGLVLCEDSYAGGGPGFEGITGRPVADEQIFQIS